MIKRIESRKNPRYREWLAISQHDSGRKKGLVFLEGLRLCQDAVQSQVVVHTVLIADHAGQSVLDFAATLSAAEQYQLPQSLFRSLGDTKNPQGIALVCDAPDLSDHPDQPDPQGLYLLADQISDPGNLGTMIRTADAFAFDGVLVTAGSVWPLHPKVLRASMGSSFHIPLFYFDTIRTAVEWLKSADIQIIAADAQGSEPLSALTPCGSSLIIGSEAHGISPEVKKLADQIVRIPMPGKAESLNAAAAAAVLCYVMMEINRNDR